MKLLVDNVTLRGTETRISLRSRDNSIEIGNEKKREREENLSLGVLEPDAGDDRDRMSRRQETTCSRR